MHQRSACCLSMTWYQEPSLPLCTPHPPSQLLPTTCFHCPGAPWPGALSPSALDWCLLVVFDPMHLDLCPEPPPSETWCPMAPSSWSGAHDLVPSDLVPWTGASWSFLIQCNLTCAQNHHPPKPGAPWPYPPDQVPPDLIEPPDLVPWTWQVWPDAKTALTTSRAIPPASLVFLQPMASLGLHQ